jgi:hypothetical protein
MGNLSTKTSLEATPHEKAIIQRLRQMQLERDNSAEDDEYVHVGSEQVSEKNIRDMIQARSPGGLSVSLMEMWQNLVLEDPKNRCVSLVYPFRKRIRCSIRTV